jgi:hypothetical protein
MKRRLISEKIVAPALVTLCLALISPISGSAAIVADPPNDFLSTFNGPHNRDLDVLDAALTLNGANFEFTASFNGTIGETPGAIYVLGINRRAGISKFANIGEADVLFDATVVISAAGAGTVNDLINKTAAPLSDVIVSGSTISAVIPVGDLPSEGLSPNNYEFNLWPEAGAANPGNTEISDFAPDNSDARVSTTPEPGTMSLSVLAITAVSVFLRRCKRA